MSLILLLLIILIAQKILFQEKTIQNASAISTTNNIGVYWNQKCTETVTSINWGNLSPGESKNITLYMRNQDNITIILTINTTNWNPENAPEFLIFSWTSTNTKIEPQQVVKVTLTLHVKQNIKEIKEFSFDITLTAKQIFEDSFESGNFNSWSGITKTSGASASILNVKTYVGSYSAKFEAEAIISGIRRACVYRDIGENSIVFARGYFYIDEGLPLTDNDDHFTLIQFLNRNGGIIANLQIRHVQGEDRFAIYTFNNLITTATVYPQPKAWYCLELYFKVHSTEGAVKAYINGVEHLAINSINTASLGNITTIRFGLANSVNIQQKITVYGDCFAINSEYIGPCTRKVDLGGGCPPAFFEFDGILDGKDVALFLQCYRGIAPAEAMVLGDIGGGNPPTLFAFDGIVDGRDLSLLLQCYKRLEDG